jgi:methionine synthase II (cobalamin-independent)
VAEKQAFPWAAGTATGVGSMPGENPLEAARVVAGELPDFPHLAELPGRGPGADIIGRAAGLLVDIPVELAGPRGWRIAERSGRDLRRARSLLSSDLDAMEEALDGYGGLVKVQLAGPWTLAAAIEQPRSLNPALADPGLVTDLAASLAEGAAAHVAEVGKRLPKATVVMQLDEPALPAVLGGAVPTPSGLSRVRAVEDEVAREMLRQVLAATPDYTVVHCCGGDLPFGIIMSAGADGISFDPAQLRRGDFDGFAEAAEAGAGLLIGALPTTGPREAVPAGQPGARRSGRDPGTRPKPSDTARIVRDLWHKMDLPPADCAPQVVITPACGLAGASPKQAQDALRWCREAAAILPEIMEEQG